METIDDLRMPGGTIATSGDDFYDSWQLSSSPSCKASKSRRFSQNINEYRCKDHIRRSDFEKRYCNSQVYGILGL